MNEVLPFWDNKQIGRPTIHPRGIFTIITCTNQGNLGERMVDGALSMIDGNYATELEEGMPAIHTIQ